MSATRVAVGAAAATGIGDVLFSSRSYREYRAMFALTGADLSGRILDCPGGAAGFTAVAARAGVAVRSCDPAYGASPQELDARSTADLARASRYVDAHPDQYTWGFFADRDAYRAERAAARAEFVADYTAHRHRYVLARLPELPFADQAFDLAVCSHLLFSWADRLDLGFHLDAVLDLARVAARVRIFPLFAMGAGPDLDLDPLLDRLRQAGLHLRVRPVDYRFQRGRAVMLEVGRADVY